LRQGYEFLQLALVTLNIEIDHKGGKEKEEKEEKEKEGKEEKEEEKEERERKKRTRDHEEIPKEHHPFHSGE